MRTKKIRQFLEITELLIHPGSFVVEPALSSLAGSATVGHDKYAYLTAFPSNENGQITAEIYGGREHSTAIVS